MRGYGSVTEQMMSTSIPCSTGLGGALGAIVEPVSLARFAPQRGYASASDWAMNQTQPVSTGLFGRLAGLGDDWSPGTDEEMTEPVEAPRSGIWDFLGKVTEQVPTVLVKGVDAYKVYQTQGGGAAGAQAAILDVFGVQAQARAQQAAAAQAKAQAAAAAKGGGISTTTMVVGGIALAAIAYAATR